FDVEAGTAATLEHLLALGHRRIGHLASAHVTDTFVARERRADAVLDAAGVPAEERPRARSAFDLEAARAAARELLAAGATAVHCDDDVLASGVVLAARDRGMRVPADVS